MTKKPATPMELAKYGHIAAHIRNLLKVQGWSSSELVKQLGAPPGSAHIYRWIDGKGGPDEKNRTKLAKMMGIKEEDLRPRSAKDLMAPTSHAVMAATPSTPPVRKANPGEVLQFGASADGEVRIRLDITLPAEEGVALFRTLLDAGIIVTGPIEGGNGNG